MTNMQNNEKLSEIKKIPEYTPWPPSKSFVDPCWLENGSLIMLSETVEGFKGKRRDMSTRFTYGNLFQLILKLMTTMLSETYRLSGKFDFAINATNAYCDNMPAGRNVITYNNLRNWLNAQSGFSNTLNSITYGDDVNPKY